nr:ATP/GTP-binding protein [Candidatus Sigynarchaeota archaeon]
MTTLLVLGPAGSGKTTLVRALWQHVKNVSKYPNVIACNLDPGTEDTSKWDIDVRDLFTVQRIMRKYALGPNGAITKAYELLANSTEVLFGTEEQDTSNLRIIDAPGQLEPLIFSETGNQLLDSMRALFNDMTAVFLLPGDVVNRPTDYAFLLMTLTGLHLKIHVPVIHVISKADLLDPASSDYISDGYLLKKRIVEENAGQMTDFALHSADLMEQLLPRIHVVKIAITKEKQEGLDSLLDLIDETKCSCGDLT